MKKKKKQNTKDKKKKRVKIVRGGWKRKNDVGRKRERGEWKKTKKGKGEKG